MRNFILSLLSVISFATYAGEHSETVDRFDKSVKRTFVMTPQEYRLSGGEAVMQLSDFDEDTQTFLLAIGSSRATECNRRLIELRTSTGAIHTLDATEIKLRNCFVRVKAELVKNSFTVRLPMFTSPNLILEMDTSTLDPFRLRK